MRCWSARCHTKRRTMIATQEFVVPRSIPITSPASGPEANHLADAVVSASPFRRSEVDAALCRILLRRPSCNAMAEIAVAIGFFGGTLLCSHKPNQPRCTCFASVLCVWKSWEICFWWRSDEERTSETTKVCPSPLRAMLTSSSCLVDMLPPKKLPKSKFNGFQESLHRSPRSKRPVELLWSLLSSWVPWPVVSVALDDEELLEG